MHHAGTAFFAAVADVFYSMEHNGMVLAFGTMQAIMLMYLWLNFRHQQVVLAAHLFRLQAENSPRELLYAYAYKARLLFHAQRAIVTFGLASLAVNFFTVYLIGNSDVAYVAYLSPELTMAVSVGWLGWLFRLRKTAPIDLTAAAASGDSSNNDSSPAYGDDRQSLIPFLPGGTHTNSLPATPTAPTHAFNSTPVVEGVGVAGARRRIMNRLLRREPAVAQGSGSLDLVIERIALFADTPALVLLASCNRYLWHCIGQLYIWQHRYRAHHSLDADEEVRWLRWYMRTLRLSANGDAVSINWFRAYCHRRACDANWFKNDPGRVRSVEEMPASSREHVTVLDRVFFTDPSVRNCRVFEHCQTESISTSRRYWRSCTPRYYGPRVEITAHGSYPMSSAFLAIAATSEHQSDGQESIYSLLVWPAHRISRMQPRRPSQPCLRYCDMRGRWLLFYTGSTRAPAGTGRRMTSICVMDLATDRTSILDTNMHQSHAFLMRETADSATVLLVADAELDGHRRVVWSLWRFSIAEAECDRRCLMEGSIRMADDFHKLSVDVLDDHRFMVISHVTVVSAREETLNGASSTLTIISTRHHGQEQPAIDRRPLWSRFTRVVTAKEMLADDQLVVYSGKGWTVFSLHDGSIRASISRQAVQHALKGRCDPHILDYFFRVRFYRGNYILCPARNNKELLAVDILHPGRNERLRFSHLFALHHMKVKDLMLITYRARRKIAFEWSGVLYERIKLRACSIHALHVQIDDNYKVLDLSV
ncbi:hypothetical protein SYNPS1DRAFT_26552 [Syncephalis pseudoplumigaleata]|uniref:Uncharacterized protein n=1 Tax=Syncephalis pseudoplumigaleata TaxID=1712513 RepID=A0A4P9Z7W5_9FUNG|nr:hypothetical protein SYNPS1DRAFT_26552 [Syncephalis pseudoplumigaleata]|eukprot:RKP27820.1 hypothetical protein SYNPS1DRAFT_26552 [Syncephalis pseudoplumigaleata]